MLLKQVKAVTLNLAFIHSLRECYQRINSAAKGERIVQRSKAWEEIPEQMMQKLSTTCGISNSFNGTEDDNIHTDEIA